MLIGAIPVPNYPPNHHKMEASIAKLRMVQKDAGCVLCLVNKTIFWLLRVKNALSMLNMPVMDISEGAEKKTSEDMEKVTEELLSLINSTDSAFFQYTSGSTSLPKGVVLSHRNVYYQSIHIIGSQNLVCKGEVMVVSAFALESYRLCEFNECMRYKSFILSFILSYCVRFGSRYSTTSG